MNPLDFSPTKRPPKVGELAITLDSPRGYCVLVTAIVGDTAQLRYLDSDTHSLLVCPVSSLIATGKHPSDLVALYVPTPVSLDMAVDKERSQIDFTTVRASTKKSKSVGPKKSKDLTTEQKDVLVEIIRQRLLVLKKGG